MIHCPIHQRKRRIYCLKADPKYMSVTLSHGKQNNIQIVLQKVKGPFMALPLNILR